MDEGAKAKWSLPGHLQFYSLLGYPMVKRTLKISIGTNCTVSVFAGIPVLVCRRRHIKSRVALKEPAGPQHEPCVGNGHHWPILDAGNVMNADSVPEDYLGICY